MRIEVRHIEGCASVQTARERLAVALAATGLRDARLLQRLVPNDREAAALRFIGSPTILIDGVDPFAETDARVGLCCRLYRTPGGLERAPTIEQLIAALTLSVASALGGTQSHLTPTLPELHPTVRRAGEAGEATQRLERGERDSSSVTSPRPPLVAGPKAGNRFVQP